MKKYLISAIALLTLLSCTKEAETEIVTIPGVLNVSAIAEPYKSGISGKKDVLWQKSDTVVVFDGNNLATKFGTMEEGKAKAKFTSFFWKGDTPKYAACSSLDPDRTTCANGKVNVKFTDNQVIAEKHKLAEGTAASAGKFTGTDVTLKNVTGFIRVAFADETVGSVRIESVDGEPLAGEVMVDCEKLQSGDPDFWTPVEGKTSSCITLSPSGNTAAENGCFLPDSMFVALLPQTYAHGIRFTLLDRDGNTILKKTEGYEGGLNIPRRDVQRLESGLDDTLPAVILVRVDFYNENSVNPFGTFPAIADQVVDGEDYTYTHKYTQDGEEKTMELSFGLSRGDALTVDKTYGYSYAAHNASFYGQSGGATDGRKILNMNNHNVNGSGHTPFWIRIPKIKSRKIDSIELGIGNGSAKNFELRDTPKGSALYKGSSSIGTKTALGSVQFNNSGKGMGLTDGPYYVALTSKNGYQLYYLEIKYVR